MSVIFFLILTSIFIVTTLVSCDFLFLKKKKAAKIKIIKVSPKENWNKIFIFNISEQFFLN